MIAIDQKRNNLIILIDYFAQEALKASEAGRAWCDTTDLIFFRAERSSYDELFTMYRKLVNVRPPMDIDPEIREIQSRFLKEEIKSRGVVDAQSLFSPGKTTAVYRGDITSLKIDGIVNAANSQMLGCWAPLHDCIDNCIHTYAGTDLRMACHKIMTAQGTEETPGHAKITKGYNLPAKYILHTVGPVICGKVTEKDMDTLESCYTSCLDLAAENGLRSIAFCCISTGAFNFPNDIACTIAVNTVKKWQREHSSTPMKVLFTVFKDADEDLYIKAIK